MTELVKKLAWRSVLVLTVLAYFLGTSYVVRHWQADKDSSLLGVCAVMSLMISGLVTPLLGYCVEHLARRRRSSRPREYSRAAERQSAK